MIRLFVSDIDGTLLNKQAQLGEEEAAIIKKMQNEGIIFMLASGRNNYKATLVVERKGLKCPSICLNGAAIYSAEKEKISAHYLPIEAVDKIHQLSLETKTILAFHANESIYSIYSQNDVDTYFADWQKTKTGYQNSYADLSDCWFNVDMKKEIDYSFIRNEKPLKAEFIFCKNEAKEYITDSLQQEFNLNICGSGFVNNLEITSVEAEKGKAIRDYCKLFNIQDDEVAVIGDSDNDVGMFKEYPKYSFAMGNSPDHVKREAAFVTLDNDSHGFLKAAEKILQLNEGDSDGKK